MDVARYARQIALSEVGPQGQARLGAARALLVGHDLTVEIARLYLEAGGLGTVVALGERPADLAGWLAALEGMDVVVRSGFDDDALLAAAAQRGVPVVVVRAQPQGVDLVSFDLHAPPSSQMAPVAAPAAVAPSEGETAVLAGTLAAGEAMAVLLAETMKRERPPIRHLRLPLDGGEPTSQRIGAA